MRYYYYILLINILSFFLGCNNVETNQNLDKQTFSTGNNSISVKVKVLKSNVFDKQIVSNGIVESQKKSELRFKKSNRVSTIKVKNGQKVNKGEILAILDNEIEINEVEKAKIALAKAKRKFHEEKINYELDGVENIDIPPVTLKNIKVKSGYLEAQNALSNAQILLNQTLLIAPFDGVIGNLVVKNGNYISTGDVFCVIISQGDMEVSFSVLENELPFIKKSQILEINPFVLHDEKYTGIITEINPLIDENGLVRIKAEIKKNAGLFDGMRVKVFVNEPIENMIVIPKEALVRRSDKEIVFTIKKDLAKWNYVEVFDENSNGYAIKKGLNIGDTIIVSGNLNLSHDAKVKIEERKKSDEISNSNG